MIAIETPSRDPKHICHLPMHDATIRERGTILTKYTHERTAYTHSPFLPFSWHTNSMPGRGNTSTGFLTTDAPYTPSHIPIYAVARLACAPWWCSNNSPGQ